MPAEPASGNGQDGQPSRPDSGLPGRDRDDQARASDGPARDDQTRAPDGPARDDQVRAPDGPGWDGPGWGPAWDGGGDGQAPVPGEGCPGVWFSLAGVAGEAELDLAGLGQGGLVDTRAPDAVLAALAEMACDPPVLAALGDDQVLGLAAAGRRLAARGAWIQQMAVAEFAGRRLEPDRKKATGLGFADFAADELVPQLVIPATDAELAMAEARDAARRLCLCTGLLRDGRISAYQLQIIGRATSQLDDAGAAEADRLLAAAAPGLTPPKLRAMAARVVMMIDPAAAARRKESAARQVRVERYREDSGNAALSGREMPPDQVLAASQHIDACARALRAAGAPGTLQELRARVFLDLTQGRDPLDQAPATATADDDQAPASAAPDRQPPEDQAPQDQAPGDATPHGQPPEDEADNDTATGPRPDHGRSGDKARATPAVKAAITLLVPIGTALGWSTAPAEIPGFGPLDPPTTRDMLHAAAAHPHTRWCITLVSPDGTAAAHGCAPGRHPWPPPDGPGPPGPAPPGPARQAAQVTALLRRLRVQLSPIAKGTCDHRHHSDSYIISRKLKHLIQARTIKCTAPGCNRPAAHADADHTIPWPAGPSCECNLGAPCRYHHRNKQAPGWRLEQPEPGVMKWHTPSGRIYTTYPTKYLI